MKTHRPPSRGQVAGALRHWELMSGKPPGNANGRVAAAVEVVQDCEEDGHRSMGAQREPDRDAVGADPQRLCAGCQIPFTPRATWHQLCRQCYAGAAAILAIRRARRLLQAA